MPPRFLAARTETHKAVFTRPRPARDIAIIRLPHRRQREAKAGWLFLSPRLNEQLVDQKRVGVLQMIDESSPVLAQLRFRQDAGVNDLLVQHIKQRKEVRTPVFPGAYGANVNFDSYVLDASFAKVSSELPADEGVCAIRVKCSVKCVEKDRPGRVQRHAGVGDIVNVL